MGRVLPRHSGTWPPAQRVVRFHVNHLWQTAQNHVEARAAQLRALPYEALSALPSYAEEPAPVDLPKMKVAIWRETGAADSVRIIVQAFRHYLGGVMTRTAVAGFDKHVSGAITEVPEGEFE